MKPIVTIYALAVLAAVAPNRSCALEGIDIVTKERAKELGLEFRSSAAGPDAVRVELEFEVRGELRGYHRVALELYDGRKLLASSTLKEEEAKPGHVVVSFAASRVHLGQVSLKVVAFDRAHQRTGHVISVKEFVDLEKLR